MNFPKPIPARSSKRDKGATATNIPHLVTRRSPSPDERPHESNILQADFKRGILQSVDQQTTEVFSSIYLIEEKLGEINNKIDKFTNFRTTEIFETLNRISVSIDSLVGSVKQGNEKLENLSKSFRDARTLPLSEEEIDEIVRKAYEPMASLLTHEVFSPGLKELINIAVPTAIQAALESVPNRHASKPDGGRNGVHRSVETGGLTSSRVVPNDDLFQEMKSVEEGCAQTSPSCRLSDWEDNMRNGDNPAVDTGSPSGSRVTLNNLFQEMRSVGEDSAQASPSCRLSDWEDDMQDGDNRAVETGSPSSLRNATNDDVFQEIKSSKEGTQTSQPCHDMQNEDNPAIETGSPSSSRIVSNDDLSQEMKSIKEGSAQTSRPCRLSDREDSHCDRTATNSNDSEEVLHQIYPAQHSAPRSGRLVSEFGLPGNTFGQDEDPPKTQTMAQSTAPHGGFTKDVPTSYRSGGIFNRRTEIRIVRRRLKILKYQVLSTRLVERVLRMKRIHLFLVLFTSFMVLSFIWFVQQKLATASDKHPLWSAIQQSRITS